MIAIGDQFKIISGQAMAVIDELQEAYSQSKAHNLDVFTVNVSADKIHNVFYLLCRQIAGDAYFTLEIENLVNNSPTEDIYFWPGMGQSQFWRIYEKYGELLAKNGAIRFGYASHTGVDEVYVGPYKTIRVFTNDPQKYERVLRGLEYPKEEKLLVPEEYFSSSDKKEPFTHKESISDIASMLEDMEPQGLRLGKRVYIR